MANMQPAASVVSVPKN